MKKSLIVLFVLVFLVSSLAFAGGSKESTKTSEGISIVDSSTATQSTESEVINSNVATVNLIKHAVITEEMVEERLETYKDYGVTREDVINSLVEDELLQQAIEKDGFDAYIDYYTEMSIEQFKSSAAEQLGRELTEEELNLLSIQTYGEGYKEVCSEYAETYVAKSYVQVKKADKFENAALPTEDEIKAFYNQNISSFVAAENVKLAHVYFKFDDTESKEDTYNRAKNVADMISNGSLTFEDAVSAYSDDTSSKEKNGEIGYFALDDQSNIQAMGQNFVDEIFKLKIGEVSSAIESNVGYHIVRISEHNDSRLLSLDENLAVGDKITVSEYIKNYLTEVLYEKLVSEAYKEVIEDLKAEASIRYIGQ